MGVHKYLLSDEDFEESQWPDCQGIEINRLQISTPSTPVVVAANPDRITTNWWDYEKQKWRSHQRRHLLKKAYRQGPIKNSMYMPWSNRASASGYEKTVFTLFKRQVPIPNQRVQTALWLDYFEWDDVSSGLIRKTDLIPIRIPLGEGLSDNPISRYLYSGYWIWSEVDTSRKELVILTQAFREPENDLDRPVDFDLGIAGFGPRPIDPQFDTMGIGRSEGEYDWDWHEETDSPVIRPRRLVPVLLMLKAPVSASIQELKDPRTWTVKELGGGGWDFDAAIDAGNLHVIFREEPYCYRIAYDLVNPQVEYTVTIDNEEDPNLAINPLHYLSIDLGNLSVQSDSEVPGGEHPQFQNLQPVTLTLDRLSDSKFVVFPPDSRSRRNIGCEPFGYKKYLVIHTGSDNWSSGPLMRVSFRPLPRDIFHRIYPSMHGFLFLDPASNALEFSTLDVLMPLYLKAIDADAADGVKGSYYRFLHHSELFDSLGVSSFFCTISGSEIIIDNSLTSYLPIDINHEQISRVSCSEEVMQTSGSAENSQFLPVESSPEFSDNYSFLPDNTIGGSLAAERFQPGLSFYAYTDMGDGGVRVVFEDGLELPDGGLPANIKDFDPGSTIVPRTSGMEWIDIRADEWTDADLPYMPLQLTGMANSRRLAITRNDNEPVEVRTMYSQVLLLIDIITAFVKEDTPTPGDAVIIRRDSLTDLEVFIHLGQIASGDSEAEPPNLWNQLWRIASYDPESGDTEVNTGRAGFYVQFHDQDFILGPYKLLFRFRGGEGQWRRDRIEIHVPGDNKTFYRFRKGRTQGRVDYSFVFGFSAQDINWSLKPYTLKQIETEFRYIRSFTPAILMREQRSEEPLAPGEQLDTPVELTSGEAASLSMKPIGDTRIKSISADAKVDVDGLSGYVVSGLIGIFAGTILGILVHGLVIAMSLIIGSFPWNPILGFAIAIGVAIFFFWVALPPIIEGIVRNQIKAQVESDKMRKSLDDSGFMNYAGEGCAEAIARKLINAANSPGFEIDSRGIPGWNRFQGQLWQTVIVTAGKLKMLIRR